MGIRQPRAVCGLSKLASAPFPGRSLRFSHCAYFCFHFCIANVWAQVLALDLSCGNGTKQLQYSISQEASHDQNFAAEPELFKIHEKSGKICLANQLDFETANRLQFSVHAHNQAGKFTRALVNIIVEDVNDNAPQFEPVSSYNLALIAHQTPVGTPLLQVLARDADTFSNFGLVRYSLDDESEWKEWFKIDSTNGTLMLAKPFGLHLVGKSTDLFVQAKDGGGLHSVDMAKVRITILRHDDQNCVNFAITPYEFHIAEDILPGIAIGAIQIENAEEDDYHLSILDDHQTIESNWGRLIVVRELDADQQDLILLNVQAESKLNGCKNYTQIKILIDDVNDNTPIFNSDKVEVNLSEDFPIHEPFFAVQATDKDKHQNGRITYEFVDSDPPACPVMVHPSSGQLVLAAPLDFESVQYYSVRIRAQDQGIPPKSAIQELHLNVVDVNDNSPKFQQQLYSIEVPENIELMQQVLKVEALDRDSDENGRVGYRLVEHGPAIAASPFGINGRTGEIFANSVLDREIQSEYFLLIVASDNGKPQRSSNISVRVRVLDINDNTPNCSSIEPLTISDLHNPRDVVGWIRAVDPDEGANGTLSYRLQQIHDWFEVRPKGDVFLRRKLNASDDRKRRTPYRLSVVVEDQGPDPRSAVCQLLIRTISATESSAVTVQEPIERVIKIDKEKIAAGKEIIKINATNAFGWSLDKNEISDLFTIENGAIVPKNKIVLGDSNVFNKTHLLNVNIFDRENRPKHLAFTLKPTAESLMKGDDSSVGLSNPPILVKIQRQKAINGMKLLSLRNERELNPSADVFYKIVSQIPSDPIFELDELTGEIYLAESQLPGSNQPPFPPNEYNLIIEENPKTFLNSSHRKLDYVNIEIVDSTSAIRPRFSNTFLQFNVSEDAHVGYLVGQVEANIVGSPNADVSPKYSIVGEGTASSFFDVDQQTGDIYLKRQLSYNALTPNHILVIEAIIPTVESEMAYTSRCVVQIEIVDTNNNAPEFLSPPNCTVFHYKNLDEPIHYFVARDDDSPDLGQVSYEIIGGNERELFSLDPLTGALTLSNKNNSLEKEIFPMRIRTRATDGYFPNINSNNKTDGLTRRKRLQLHTDQSFAVFADSNFWNSLTSEGMQYFEKPHYDFTMAKGTPAGAVIYNFKRIDLFDEVQFRIFPQSQTAFQIGQSDGILRANETLNAEKYIITVYMSRKGEQSEDDHVTVAVHLIDSALRSGGPKIIPSSCGNVSVRENMAVEDLVRIFAVIEGQSNANNEVELEIYFKIEGGSGSRLFSIDEKTGAVSCKELDRESQAEHLLVISASDNGSPKKADVCTVRVLVLDENDNVPIFSLNTPASIEITNSSKVSESLARIQALDLDDEKNGNGNVRYRLSSDPSRMLDLRPDSGELIFARELPFSEKQWTVTIIAEDSGQSRILNSEKTIQIVWKRSQLPRSDPISQPPQFLCQKYLAVVAEGQSKGQFVAQLDTTLTDMQLRRNSPLAYSIVGGNYDNAFEVDDSGRIITKLELDAEIRAEYNLALVGTSPKHRENSMRTEVNVKILNTNDNPPSIPPLRPIKLSEALPIGSLITTIVARDVDPDSLLEYSLQKDKRLASEFFDIGRFSGKIHLRKPMDFEIQQKFVLGIQVFDGVNVAQSNLTIELIDVNDNAPSFESDFIQIEVSSSTAVNSTVATVRATDMDSGENGRVTYKVTSNGGKSPSLFEVDSNNGHLRLLKRLSRTTTHFVEITASDHGRPSLSSTVVLKIVVVTKSERDSPAFKYDSYRFMVSEEFPAFLPFGRLSLANESSKHCGFRVISSRNITSSKLKETTEDPSNIFGMSPAGGLFLRRSLDREIQAEYHFEMKSEEDLSSICTVVVQLADANDNAPVFDGDEEDVVKIRVSEHTNKGSVVGRLLARDQDSEENGRIRYKMLAGDDHSMVRLNSDSGTVYFDHWDDDAIFFAQNENFGALKSISKELVFLAQDGGIPTRATPQIATLELDTSEWSGILPAFPFSVVRRFVAENTPIGQKLFRIRAFSRIGGKETRVGWKYSLSSNVSESVRQINQKPLLPFSINESTADIYLQQHLDFETGPNHMEVVINVQDEQGRHASVPLQVFVYGVDEFPPVFSKTSYTFQIPPNCQPGQKIGSVAATDLDVGLGSQIFYFKEDEKESRAENDNSYRTNHRLSDLVRLDRDTGEIILKRKLPDSKVAESKSKTRLAKAVVYLEIGKQPSLIGWSGPGSPPDFSSLSPLTFVLIVLFIAILALLAFFLMRIFRQATSPRNTVYGRQGKSRANKMNKQVYSVSNSARSSLKPAVMADVNRLSPSPTFERGQEQCQKQQQSLGLPPPPPPSVSPSTLSNKEEKYFSQPYPPSRSSSNPASSSSSCANSDADPNHYHISNVCKIQNQRESRSKSQPDSGIISDPDGEAISVTSATMYDYALSVTNGDAPVPQIMNSTSNNSISSFKPTPTARVISVEFGPVALTCTSSFRQTPPTEENRRLGPISGPITYSGGRIPDVLAGADSHHYANLTHNQSINTPQLRLASERQQCIYEQPRSSSFKPMN
ncbi:cadherin domain-containing protein [Ditylenchus destructor]|uniref:Cadherin domain-containing protein n=1 Tax=Ditylenchus destructor TaxID=166010 RepID=A0AAD4R1N2_9BILA|nr:cadherin domain-containing protein [Ditylenchus destructor]